MNFELLLDNGLNMIISETFNQVELIFKDCQTEKNWSIFELAGSEFKFSYSSYFFNDSLYFAF